MSFEEYLQEKFVKIEPGILDDDLVDAFEFWICNLSVNEWLDYGEEYAKQVIKQVKI